MAEQEKKKNQEIKPGNYTPTNKQEAYILKAVRVSKQTEIMPMKNKAAALKLEKNKNCL